jgi:gentisate 1,2-dioxygenase
MDPAAFYNKPETTEEFLEFYKRLEKKNAAPLWESLAELVPVVPRPRSIPTIWRYEELRPFVMESGKLITAKDAERRVLILENPGVRGSGQVTDTLYAGLQLILPGEIAPTHRHTASALRFIIEGNGAYTAVDGERTTMHPGDFILTPSWTYHDHGNPSDSPTIWMDGLDIPLVNLFNTGFAEHYPQPVQPVSKKEGDAWTRYGGSLMPIEYTHPRKSSPVFSYPYTRTRETLCQLYSNGPSHQCHGIKLQYINPATGGYPMPAIGAFVQLLPSGFRGDKYRSTDATVFCVVEGQGQTRIGNAMFEWKQHDIFVAPSWYTISHEAQSESVLFSFSDRPVQKALGIWREEVPIVST